MGDERRREYQRAYDARRKGDGSLMDEYKEKYGVEGVGRPKYSRNKKEKKGWIKIGLTVSPEMSAYLDKQKKDGKDKSKVIDEALKLHKQTKQE